jgi:hypothetical protein
MIEIIPGIFEYYLEFDGPLTIDEIKVCQIVVIVGATFCIAALGLFFYNLYRFIIRQGKWKNLALLLFYVLSFNLLFIRTYNNILGFA